MKVEVAGAIPLTILTGFLGAGKTTLLNRILNGDHGLRAAILVNDFGAISVDSKLIVGIEGDMINLSNGCMCCSIRGDLVSAVTELLAQPEPPEYLIIEASGVSDPGQMILAFTRSGLRNRVEIDGIITLVDAEQFLNIAHKQQKLARDQVSAANIVIINKVDLVSDIQLQELKDWITEIVPGAHLIETQYCEVPLQQIINIGQYSPQRAFAMSPHKVHVHDAGEQEYTHNENSLVFSTFVWRCEQPLLLQEVYRLINALPATIYRAKGIIYSKEIPDQRGVLHIVGKRASVAQGDPWKPNEKPYSELVMIGEEGSINPDEMREAWETTIAMDNPTHNSSTSYFMEWLRQ